nr:hypothetical protein [Sphingomonas changnyeongensis]
MIGRSGLQNMACLRAKGATMAAMAGLALVGGCTARPAPLPRALPVTPPVLSVSGLERVLGATAAGLVALFGPPELDIREDQAVKLQFAGPICVLDAYLYRTRARGEPVVTYVDARQPDGRDIDRASCVAALAARHRPQGATRP